MEATSVTDYLLLWPHYFIIHSSEIERQTDRQTDRQTKTERHRKRRRINPEVSSSSFVFLSPFFLSSRLSLRSHHMWFWMSDYIVLIGFCLCVCLSACACVCFHIHRSGTLTALFGCYMAGASWNCCRLGTRSGYTLQLCNSLQCHFIRSYICWVHVCLAVTCRFSALLTECPASFTCYCGNTGVEGIPK